MVDDANLDQLREIVSNVLHDICQLASHPRLDGELIRFGLLASTAGDSKAERAESSIAAITVDQLPAIAQRLLDGYEHFRPPTRNQIQDLLWAATRVPTSAQTDPPRHRSTTLAGSPGRSLRAFPGAARRPVRPRRQPAGRTHRP
ncbi:hypothetical protein ACQPZJ_37965 [Actinoplanes sp. CA-054009]